ncbi:DUF501 domain-containing protein [Candidatus Acetothermia bacterium]|nr:MAG: DUF501 domain-containing protein [Candidatus Acetothermia bacterium]
MDRPPTPRDLEIVSRQLGRPARGVVAIARDCPYGYPQVTVNHPLRREGDRFEVFPTLFWLTCPFLVEEVARLESAGWVKRLEARLKAEPELAAGYARAHEKYRAERLALISPEEEKFLREKGAWDAVETGVAGLRNPLRVKCLHAQLGHFLARGDNPVGALVAQLLPALHCPPDAVGCKQARSTGRASVPRRASCQRTLEA